MLLKATGKPFARVKEVQHQYINKCILICGTHREWKTHILSVPVAMRIATVLAQIPVKQILPKHFPASHKSAGKTSTLG